MAGRSTDHRTSHRETHQQEHRPEHGEESIADWQTQALTPFTENLHHRNPELAREIAREYQAVTGTNTAKNHVSWMDDHDQKANHPGAYIYEQRQMTKAEEDILLSYRHAAEHMDQVQADFASTTIMEAMTHRTNAHFSEHFPQSVDDFALHHGKANVPDPDSYNNLMQAAREYYGLSIQETERMISAELKSTDSWEPNSMTWAVDALRSLEQDLIATAETSDMPSYMDRGTDNNNFYERYHHRANALAESFSQDFRETHPGQPLDPDSDAYVTHFHEATKDYSPGDLHNLADHIAYNQGLAKAFSSGARTPEELQYRGREFRAHTFQNLSGDPDPTAA